MRKHKIIKIDGREITVHELRVVDYLELFEQAQDLDVRFIEKNISRVTDLSVAEFKEMAPSEIMLLWTEFKEVNADFFGWSAGVGLTSLLTKIKEDLTARFSGLFADSLRQAIQNAGITVSASSSLQRTNTQKSGNIG